MPVFKVKQTFEYVSDVEADDEEEALAIAQEDHVSGADVVDGLVRVKIVKERKWKSSPRKRKGRHA